MANRFDTHEVVNQPPSLTGYDVFGADSALVEGVARNGADWVAGELHDLRALPIPVLERTHDATNTGTRVARRRLDHEIVIAAFRR